MHKEHGLRPKINANIDPKKKPTPAPTSPRGLTIELDIDDTKAREKLQLLERDLTCEHDYEMLHSNETTFYADSKAAYVRLDAVFYCRKCLDLQQRELELNG